MPTLAVDRDYLFSLVGQEYTRDEFDRLCFEFGIELDEVTSQREIFRKEHAQQMTGSAEQRAAFEAKLAAIPDDELYKIDTPANRYDLLSAEGMATALRVFNKTLPLPKFKVHAAQTTLTVAKCTKGVRSYCVCAILRNINFTPKSYLSFIDYQEKLHSGLARKRTLASIGTHDLDKVSGPFTFRMAKKEDIVFNPLNQPADRILNCAGNGLEQFYEADRQISKYVPLLKDLESYPVVFDSTDKIMSMPPIINSNASRIQESTKNIFIECTAPDYHKASLFVANMVCAFSQYCADPFSVEAVNVVYEAGEALAEARAIERKARAGNAAFRGDTTQLKAAQDAAAVEVAAEEKTLAAGEPLVDVTPRMNVRPMDVPVDVINSRVGINVSAEKCVELLNRMMLEAEVVDSNTVRVGIPAPRADVLHPCDLIEDVAIAYGYDNIDLVPVPTRSSGSQNPMNKLVHLLRLEIAAAGYTEMLSFSLCSRDEAFANLGRKDTDTAVHIQNPQTFEFQICRPSLLPGTLKTLQANKKTPLPIKLFEISDVVKFDQAARTGARNERHFAVLHAQTESPGFQDVQGVVEYALMKLGITKRSYGVSAETHMANTGEAVSYRFDATAEAQDAAFFPGRCMNVVLDILGEDGAVKTEVIGNLGVLHPDVLKASDIATPCSFGEFNLHPLLPYC